MMEKCRLILGDCLKKMKELPESSIDLVVTDPPFNFHFGGGAAYLLREKFIIAFKIVLARALNHFLF